MTASGLKITAIDVKEYKWERDVPISNGLHTYTNHEISFVEVIRAIDGPIALVPCASENFYQRCDDCHDEATCAIRRVLLQVRSSAVAILENTSLADAAGAELAVEALTSA